MTPKNRKQFLSDGCSLLRAEGYCCSSNVLHGGLWKNKLQFLKKKVGFFSAQKIQALNPDPH
jgi:hypothetical protein